MISKDLRSVLNAGSIIIGLINAKFFYFFISLIILFVNLFVSSNILRNIGYLFFVIFVVTFILSIYINLKNSNKIKLLAKILNMSWTPDLTIGIINATSVIYYPNSKTFYFVNPVANIYASVPHDFFRNVELEVTTKTVAKTEGNRNSAKTHYKEKEYYSLILFTNDFNMPRISIPIKNGNDARNWKAKLELHIAP
ncbi:MULTISPECIES: hypothetical protein [unclassified Gilliamella]|uniref:hypothetical protein n=1 Tax=unclassified Gilliamella TaxID=2685620 RepID=UPI00226A9F0B|nr:MULTISPECIES: hypothetical protein [unclassified Gilliamella]MCX8584273.1 hypothetical protein [Gilliamella sp. B3372]MCX8595345.1 hypothetical protein [Gilliamella sp. B3367]